MIAGAVMLASGAACLGGAVVTRSRIGLAAAIVMALAMVDHVLIGFVPPVVWAALLVLAGILLGVGLRFEPSAAARSPRPLTGDVHRLTLHTMVMGAAALAYPAMAWLLLAHDHGPHGTQSEAAGAAGAVNVAAAHAHHGSFAAMLALIIIVPLTAALTGLGIAAGVRRRPALAVEAVAMAAMLLAMLVPTVM